MAVLVAANLLNNRHARPAFVVTSVVAAGLLLVVFGSTGLDWAAAGLGWAAVDRGLRWGLLLVALVAAGYLAVAALPATRVVFLDRRVERAGPATVAYHTLVRIPFGTVLLEEIAFRGVLYGLVAHVHGVVWATVVAAVLFGLWHVLPALDLVRLNVAANRLFRSHPALVVPAAVVATALVGVVLCELRRRTGSLVPVLAVHWATNAFGYLAAFLATPRQRGRPRPRRTPCRGRGTGGPVTP